MKTTKVILVVCTMIAVLLGCQSIALTKSDIKVLYVGVDPQTAELSESDKEYISEEHQIRLLQFMRARTSGFEDMLKDYFANVDVVYADNYHELMSEGYDVTIFGDPPKPIKPKVIEQDKNGKVIKYVQATYLSDEFDNASILIGHVSPLVAEPLDYKMNWLCLCLDAFAHDVQQDHEIFKQPYDVNLTLTQQPTPENYFRYFNGKDLPSTLPMWRVQTEGYMEDKGFPIGMVSSGSGFVDGDDAEIISFGVNTKPVNAVSLGRHGNFFHWGFAANPAEMTPEAKKVFINSVHYIAKFDGQLPYSKRKNRGLTRNVAMDQAYRASKIDDEYRAYIDLVSKLNAEDKERIEIKQAEGKKLSFSDKRILAQSGKNMPTRNEFISSRILKRLPASVVEKFGTNFESYLPYYLENLEYLIEAEDRYQYVVDEDIVSLGVSNRDTSILDIAISMLENGENSVTAQRILERYTTEKFSAAEEWRAWYQDNLDYFYFAEVNGHKFREIPKRAR